MAARVRRTGRVTGLERAEPETGGMTVCRALTVAAAVAAREAAGRSEAARAAATSVVVLRFVVLGPMVFGLVFLVVVVMVVMVGPVWFLVAAEYVEKRAGRPDGPDDGLWLPHGRDGVGTPHRFPHEHGRFAIGLHHASGHELSVLDWIYCLGSRDGYGLRKR